MIARREILKFGAVLAAGATLPTWASPTVAAFGSSGFGWSLQPPEAAGMTRAGLEGVRAAVQKNIDAELLTGAVTTIARHNKLVWHEAQGVRNVETRAPLRTNDIFRLASGSKPVTAVCILMLMDAGKLSIDDKVSRFIPTFKNPRVAQLPADLEPQRFTLDPAKREELKSKVTLVPADRELTLKDLLTHTAGLSTFFGMGSGSPQIEAGRTLEERIPLVGVVTLDFQPGTQWAYSPLDGFDVLAHIVEIVSGTPLDEFMRTRLFAPLDMADMTFHLSAEQQQRLVPLYRREGSAWKPGIDLLGAGDPAMKYLCGAGGLVGTARDYTQLQAMLLNRGELNGRRLLSRDAVVLMSTNHVGKLFEQFPVAGRKGWGFGLGVGVVVDPVAAGSARGRGSFGWDGAHGTDGWVDPERNLAAVYFVQQSDKSPLREFEKAIAAAVTA